MIILWKKVTLDLNYKFIGHGFVGVNINHKGASCNLVNIYAPYSIVERRDLWNNLMERFLKNRDELWCLGGDFNEVTSRDRLGAGGTHNKRGMEDFRDFIGRVGLVGGKFSCFKDNGKAMS